MNGATITTGTAPSKHDPIDQYYETADFGAVNIPQSTPRSKKRPLHTPQKPLGHIEEDQSEDEQSTVMRLELQATRKSQRIQSSPFTRFLREENSLLNKYIREEPTCVTPLEVQ